MSTKQDIPNMNEATLITNDLLNAIVNFLTKGGSHIEANLLAAQLVEQANAPARDRARQAEMKAAIDAAVSSALQNSTGSTQVVVSEGPIYAVRDESPHVLQMNANGTDVTLTPVQE